MITKDARILVTGGEGFLGSHVIDRLKMEGYTQVAAATHAKYDLVDLDAALHMYDDHAPSAVIHCAAVVGGIGANKREPGRFFYENAAMGLNVIEGARLAKVDKLVVIGTTCSYPANCTAPFKETDLWKGYPEETNAPYGIAKRMLETMCRAYREQYGMNAIYLIPANLYGPRDAFDLEDGHVIPAIIRKCCEAAAAGADSIELWGDGTPTREFLYVEDCAAMIWSALESYSAPAPLNLSNSTEISISDLAQSIARMTGFDGAIRWNATQPNGQRCRSLSDDTTRELLGDLTRTTLHDGLRRTIDWYLQ